MIQKRDSKYFGNRSMFLSQGTQEIGTAGLLWKEKRTSSCQLLNSYREKARLVDEYVHPSKPERYPHCQKLHPLDACEGR